MPPLKMRKLLSRLPKGALLLSGFSMVNVLLGFAREATIAAFFGASAELDAFLVALTIPRILAVNAATITVLVVMPVYVGMRQAGKNEEASALARGWLRLSGAVLGLICVVLLVFAEQVTGLLAPGLTIQARSDAARWLRLLLPYLWLMSAAGVFRMVLESNQKFGAPQASQGLLSILIVAAAFLGHRHLGVGSLAAGFVAGGIVGFSLQWLLATRFEPGMLSVALPGPLKGLPTAAAGVMLFQTASVQLNNAVDRFFASSLSEGSIACLNYAHTLNSIPSAVITSALATALLPVLARMAAKGDFKCALRTTRHWMLAVASICAPIVVGVWFFSEEIVSLVFQRGAFDARATRMTAGVLAVYSITIVVSAWSMLLMRLLLVQQRQKLIAVAAIFALAVKVFFNFILVGTFGLPGIAWATVLAGLGATSLRFFFASVDVKSTPVAASTKEIGL